MVSKQSQLNGLLETVLDAGQYDVVFVESTEHAYSHIKRLTPHLIIVCLDIDDLDGFQVLSMLKLDADTKDIPVVTCTVTTEEEVERRRIGGNARRRVQPAGPAAAQLVCSRELVVSRQLAVFSSSFQSASGGEERIASALFSSQLECRYEPVH